MLELYAHIFWIVATVLSIMQFVGATYWYQESQDLENAVVNEIPGIPKYVFLILILIAISIFISLKWSRLVMLRKYHHRWDYLELVTIGLVLGTAYYIEVEGVTQGQITRPNLFMVTILFQFCLFLIALCKINLSSSIFISGFLAVRTGIV